MSNLNQNQTPGANELTFDQKTGLWLPVNHSTPFYPLQEYHYNGKHAFIDSLRVRIPMGFVEVLDRTMVDEYIEFYPSKKQLKKALEYDREVVDEETGEVIVGVFGSPGQDRTTMRKKSKGFEETIHGITYRFFFKGFIHPTDKSKSLQYLVIQISAKMVKREYFDGITILNIAQIVEDINSFKKVKVSVYDLLINGLVSDIDVCSNELVSKPNLNYAFNLINAHVLPGKNKLITMHRQAKNMGVDFNARHKATNASPFVKIYHKGFELEKKSIDFYQSYLEPMKEIEMEQLVRIEFTIRNTAHRKYLKKKGLNASFKTLGELLLTPQEDLYAILKSGLPMYLDKIARNNPKIEGLTVTYMVLYEVFSYLISLGVPPSYFEDMPGILTARIKDDKVRADKKRRIKKVVETSYNNVTSVEDHLKKKLQRSEAVYNFLIAYGFNPYGLNEKLENE